MIRAFFQQPTYLNMNIIYYPNLQVHIIGSPGIFQILVNGDLVEFEEFSKLDFNGSQYQKIATNQNTPPYLTLEYP